MIKYILLVKLAMYTVIHSNKNFVMFRRISRTILPFLLLGLSAFIFCSATMAKHSVKITLYGQVYDSYTKKALEARIYVIKNGKVIDSTATVLEHRKTESTFYYDIPNTPAVYAFKARVEGYEDNIQYFELKNSNKASTYPIPIHYMKKKSMAEIDLNEVVVNGTRIQMVYRGDTIVYNASAFVLSEGSMLESLVKQLPGAELKANGDIFVNGEKVDYLTLNGKDFFKGKNKMMLENLPYYLVKGIKVFHKDNDHAVGGISQRKEYVMDVNLKREYANSSIANAELGGGTRQRFLGKAFGMYNGEHTSAILFGSLNNINQDEKPGEGGDWSPTSITQGLKTTRLWGLNLQTEDKDKHYQETLDATLKWDNTDNNNRTYHEDYTNNGSLTRHNLSFNKERDINIEVTDNVFVLKPFSASANVSLKYNNAKSVINNNDSLFQKEWVNSNAFESLTKQRSLEFTFACAYTKSFANGNTLNAIAQVDYSTDRPRNDFGRYATSYASDQQDDIRNYFFRHRQRQYKVTFVTDYFQVLPYSWKVGPLLEYGQGYRTNSHGNYRLDRIADGSQKYQQLGVLPSTEDSLAMAMDTRTSYDNQNFFRHYGTGLHLYRSTPKSFIEVVIPLTFERERMHYHQDRIDTTAYRNSTLFEPTVSINFYGKSKKALEYEMNVTRPDFESLMSYEDDTDPTMKRVNNPNLKNTITHTFRASANLKSSTSDLNLWTKARAEIIQNACGNRITFFPTQGVYVYQYDNVNGNWDTGASMGMSRSLDKKRHYSIQATTGLDFIHSVDYSVAYNTESPILSSVNTWKPNADVKLGYRFKSFAIDAEGKMTYRMSRSSRVDFESINICDFQYGGDLRCTIPGVGLDIATDIFMYSSRGYQNTFMNRNDLIWNAQISKPFYKGKLICMVRAYDILHEISSMQYIVNAQGRTETMYNSIPNYVMFSLAYKLK